MVLKMYISINIYIKFDHDYFKDRLTHIIGQRNISTKEKKRITLKLGRELPHQY